MTQSGHFVSLDVRRTEISGDATVQMHLRDDGKTGEYTKILRRTTTRRGYVCEERWSPAIDLPDKRGC
jgi:hypothetical protein